MISAVNNTYNNIKCRKSQTFKGEISSYNPILSYGADDFIKDVNKVVERQKNGNIFSKYLWSTTALIPAVLLVVPYEFYSLFKLRRLKKAGNKDAFKAASASFIKKFPWLVTGSVVLYAGLQYMFGRNFDKKYEKFKQDFERINTSTCAKLADYTINTSVIGASFSPFSGNVVISKNILRDPITSRKALKLLKHELVHARQFETIARSENGIKKLNYAVMKSVANGLNTPEGRTEIAGIYSDLLNDKTGKYENINLKILGAEINFKNYILALNALLTDENCGFDDIPMIIDEKYYQNVIDKKGKLTPEEEIKAEQYYQAELNYKATPLMMLNPFSDYYDNLLEKEAYKESPSIMTFIRKVFGKN